MIGSLKQATNNGAVFTDSRSNDFIISTSTLNQKILMGFSSNCGSALSLGTSNMVLGSISSNIRLDHYGDIESRGNLTVQKKINTSNTYISNQLGVGTDNNTSNFKLFVSGDTRIIGNLVVDGDISSINMNLSVTDQLYVVNNGTGPAFLVNQLGNTPVVAYQLNSNNVFFIAETGNVAIGSITPSQKLDVQGNALVRGNLYLSNIQCSNINTNNVNISSNLNVDYNVTATNVYASSIYMGGKLIVDNTGVFSSSNYIPDLDASKIKYGTFTSNFIQDYNIISSKLASNLTLAGTTYVTERLGVGTNNPSYGLPYVTFKVNGGDAFVNGPSTFQTAGDQARVYLGDANHFIASTNGVGMVMQAANTVYPFVLEDNSGYLGLGTTDPEERLHVTNNAKIVNNMYVMNRVGIAHSNPLETLSVAGNFSLSNFGKVVVSTSNNNIGISTAAPIAKLHVAQTVAGRDSLLIESTTNVTPTSLIVKDTGNVGLSTAVPTEILDVIGNIKASSNMYVVNRLSVKNSNAAFDADITGDLRAKYRVCVDGSSSNGGQLRLMSTNTVAESNDQWIMENKHISGANFLRIQKVTSSGGTTDSNTLLISDDGYFRIGNNAKADERLHVSSGNAKFDSNIYILQNLGVRTSNPTEVVDIAQGNVKVASNVYIMTRLGVGTSNLAYPVDIVGDTQMTGSLRLQNGNASFSSNVNITNALGVGTTTPSESLDVTNGNINTESNLYVTNRLGIANKIPTERLDISNGNLKVSSNVYAMTKIGIATSNPAVALEINTTDAILIPKGNTSQRPSIPLQGHIRFNTSLNTFEGYGAGSAWGSLGGVKDTNQDTYISPESFPTSNDDTLRFFNSNIETMRIMPSGFIGMSNQSPSERLELSGGNAKFNSNIYTMARHSIGTSNPTESLDVANGNIKASSNVYAMSRMGIATSNPAVSLEINATDAILIPKGNTSQRPTAPLQGHIRFNTALNTFEGYGAGNAWGSLGGVKDTNQDTYISPESFPTSNDDTLRFFNSNVETMRIMPSGFIGLSNQAPSERLELSGGNAKFNSNTYTMVRHSVGTSYPSESLDVANGNIKASSNMYAMSRIGIATSNPAVALEINTTDAILIPKGNTSQRPSVPLQGHIRFNTALNTFEGYGAGNAWGSLGGVKDTNQDTYISPESFPTSNDDTLRFFNSNIETMRIMPSGFIGLSNQAPSERLEISGGNAKFNSNTYTMVRQSVGTSNPSESLDVANGNIKTSSNMYAMSRVGIATSNPAVSLEINSTDAILIPKGNTSQRPSVPVQGHIRFNTALNTFEGFGAGNAWGSLGGVKDTNQDTYISPESFPTSNDDTLRFFNSNVETMRIMPTGFIGLSNQAPNERLELSGGNAKFNSNTYTMVRHSVGTSNPSESLDVSNGNIKASSNIYAMSRLGIATSNPAVALEVNATDAILIPKGNTSQRPSAPVQGHIRFNTALNTFEGYGAGNAWGSLGGVKDTNQDTYISPESFPTSNDDILRFFNSNVETMRIMPNGFIGMSNQAPSERLELSGGNAKFNSNTYTMVRHSIGTSTPGESLDVANGNIKASSNIYAMSRIGIATSNPAVALEVNSTDAILIPKGNTSQRPTAPIQGHIRFNTALNTFEGYGAGNAWGSLGGVKDTNQDTYISPESFPTSNDDTLRFFNSNVETMRIMPNGFIGMSNQAPSERLELSGGNAKFNSNTYTMVRQSVGTTNPSESLDVANGNIKASSNIYAMSRMGVGTSNPAVALEINSTDAILIPKGNTSQRPSAPVQGHIRYNTALNTFEGYGAGNAWGSLGGVKDTNQDTYISPESFPTSNDDTLRFFNSNIETMRIMPTGFIGLSNQAPSERLELSGGNAKFNSNTYIMVRQSVGTSNPSESLDVANGNIKASSNIYAMSRIGIATSNPAVSLEINSTDAVLIPKGNTSQRPAAPVQGHIRYNTALNTFEGYGAGNAWGSLGGVKDTNQDTYISAESFPTSNDDMLRFFNSNIETMRIMPTGFIGLSNQAPSERLEVSGGNAKFNSNVYVVSRLAVGHSNPQQAIHVIGNIRASNGTQGPLMMLVPPIAYSDISATNRLVLDNTLEAGNDIANSTWKPLFMGSGFLFQDTSDDNMVWNQARLIFRGTALTDTDNDVTTMTIQDFVYSRTPQYSNITSQFSITSKTKSRGYLTNASPWFTMSSNEVRHLAVYVNSSSTSSVYRFGSVYIQFRA
jgi:ubiquitin